MNKNVMSLRAQRGQAMFEMAAIAGIVVSMFLGIWYLGKYHDVQATTIQAARYSAWERTVRPTTYSDANMQEQMRARLYTWNENAFRDADRLADNANSWGTQTAMWRDHAGNDRLIEEPRDVRVTTTNGRLPGTIVGNAENVIANETNGLGRITNGEALPQGGLVTSRVTVNMDDIDAPPEPFGELEVTLTETSTLVGENWDASGPRQAAMRTRTFVLAGMFTNITNVLQPIQNVIGSIEPAFRQLRLGQVCPDIVPGDRFQGGNNLPAYRGATCF